MNNWTARVSRTEKVGTRISCEMFTAEIFDVESEDEVRKLLADEYEDWAIDQVLRMPEDDDGH